MLVAQNRSFWKSPGAREKSKFLPRSKKSSEWLVSAGCLCKQQSDKRAVFEIEGDKGRLVRGDFARMVVECGWDLNELRPSAMSLEEIFLELTGSPTRLRKRTRRRNKEEVKQ